LLDGSSGEQLTTDGSGILSWSSSGTTSLALNDLTNCTTFGTTGDVISINADNVVIGKDVSVNHGTYSTIYGNGASSIYPGSKGGSDVAIGYNAGHNLDHQSVTDASSNNTCIGTSAGYTITGGKYNTVVGASASVSALVDSQIAIGHNASNTVTNTCVIGNTELTSISSGGAEGCTLGTTSEPFGGVYLGGSTSGYNKLQCSAVGDNTTYTLPATDGTSGYLLSTNGSGVLSFVADTAVGVLGDLTDCSTTGTTGDILTINNTANNVYIGQLASGSYGPSTHDTIIGDGFVGSYNNYRTVLGSYSACGDSGVSIGYYSQGLANNATAIGANTSASGIGSTVIGKGSSSSHTNATAIGSGCSTLADNSVALGNGSVDRVTPTSDNFCTLGSGSYRWSVIYCNDGVINTSDEKSKEEIIECNLGLDFINKLKPKKYCFKGKKQPHFGLCAQDVESAIKSTLKKKDVKKYKNKGLVNYDEDSDRYGIRYSEFIAPLIKSVQELTNQLDVERTRNDSLEERLKFIESLLCSEENVVN